MVFCWPVALTLACIAAPLLLSTLAKHYRRVRLIKKGGRLMDRVFTELARSADMLTISTALAGVSGAL